MIKRVKALDKENRTYSPELLKDKQDVLLKLKSGQISTSKFNVLNDQEKMFVEYFVFGDCSAEEAMRAVIQHFYPVPPPGFSPKKLAYQIMSDPKIMEVIDDLTISRDKAFMVEVNQSRDIALKTLMFIMQTTKDDNLKAAVATSILSKAEVLQKLRQVDKQPPSGVTIEIALAGNPYGSPKTIITSDTVEVEVDEDDTGAVEVVDAQKKQAEARTMIEVDGMFTYDYMNEDEDEEDE
jgi:hypothetical protein